ncbi:MAG: Rv3235 family protein [Austwickia sp.]|nr:Rv3235 family protein [Paracoccaceae bacterium]MCO5311198.1 Rv3235 family protein [Austwickia sp.]
MSAVPLAVRGHGPLTVATPTAVGAAPHGTGPTGPLSWRSVDDRRYTPVQEQLPFAEGGRHETRKRPDTTFERQPTGTADLPPPDRHAARLAIAVVEVAAGARPATQLMRHCAPTVFESLVRRQAHRAGRPLVRRPVLLRRVRVCHIRDGVVEVTVIIAMSHRIRPVALRLEGLDGRWLITALEMG